MGKKILKATKGEVKKFISRAKALKVLGLPLKDFRRICILKGIYPRQPKKVLDKSVNKTYYHVKDITFLKHEKLIGKFKGIRAYNKKIEKALARKDDYKLKNLRANKPSYSIDHLIRERYGSFNDALNDMSDCLSTLILLGNLPSHRLLKVPADSILKSKNLMNEFKGIISEKKLLTKVFLSIKGVYYECEINGIKIVWLEPYNYSQNLKFDVDYKVILSFSEFYLCMLKYINYKLYLDFDFIYPPQIENNKVLLEKINSKNLEDEKYQISNEFQENEIVKKINKKDERIGIFHNLKFFISRETDKNIFEFSIKSNGGEVCYDINNFESDIFADSKITHVVTDRPVNGIKFLKNREYIQPQWICDCINNNLLLPIEEYKPGNSLPPHLSPFVDSKETGYKPDREKEIEKLKNDYVEESIHDSDLEESEIEKIQQEDLMGEEKKEIKYKVEKNIKSKKISKKDKLKLEKEKEKLAIATLPNKKRRLMEKIEFADKKQKEENKKLIEKKNKLDNEKMIKESIVKKRNNERKKSVEKMVEEPVTKKSKKSVEKMVEEPVVKKGKKSVEKMVEEPVVKKGKKSVEKITSKKEKDQTKKSINKPVNKKETVEVKKGKKSVEKKVKEQNNKKEIKNNKNKKLVEKKNNKSVNKKQKDKKTKK